MHAIYLVMIGGNGDMLRYKRTLPCGCILRWDEEQILIAFCILHSIDYIGWKGKDEEFIKRVTNVQREIGYVDENVLIKMR
jgi:hypothetical protein